MLEKTYQMKAKEVKHNWHLIDAKGRVLGRLAGDIARLLIGKQKVTYTPHMDAGDFVVITNAKNVKLTGKKKDQKVYRSHSGYPGGFKEVKIAKLMLENPAEVIKKAVWGMLPKNRLRNVRMTRLKIFTSSTHPYAKYFEKLEK